MLCSGYRTLKTLEARWLGDLKGLVTDFEVEHHLGQLHGNADRLSCHPWDEGALVKVGTNVTLIQSVKMECCKL